MSDQNDIDAAFEEWYERRYGGEPVNSAHRYASLVSWRAAAAFGLDKAAAIYRGVNAAADPDELARRLANSTLAEKIVTDALKSIGYKIVAGNVERLDVKG